MVDTTVEESKNTVDPGVKSSTEAFGPDVTPKLPLTDTVSPDGLDPLKDTVEVVRTQPEVEAKKTELSNIQHGTPANAEDVKIISEVINDHSLAVELVPFFAGQGAVSLIHDKMTRVNNDPNLPYEEKKQALEFLRKRATTAEDKYLGVEVNTLLQEAQKERDTNPERAAFAYDFDIHMRKYNVSTMKSEMERIKGIRTEIVKANPYDTRIKGIDSAIEVHHTKLEREEKVLNGFKDSTGAEVPGLIQQRKEIRINKTPENPQGEEISDRVEAFALQLAGIQEVNEDNRDLAHRIRKDPLNEIMNTFGLAAVNNDEAKKLKERLPALNMVSQEDAARLINEIKVKAPGFEVNKLHLLIGFFCSSAVSSRKAVRDGKKEVI